MTTIPAPRNAIRRPKHRKPIPDEHVIYLDVLLERLGISEPQGRHRLHAGPVVVLPTTTLATVGAA